MIGMPLITPSQAGNFELRNPACMSYGPPIGAWECCSPSPILAGTDLLYYIRLWCTPASGEATLRAGLCIGVGSLDATKDSAVCSERLGLVWSRSTCRPNHYMYRMHLIVDTHFLCAGSSAVYLGFLSCSNKDWVLAALRQ